MQKLVVIFITAFFLNLIWENLHVFLYANYQGGGISELILLRATLFDAIFITVICLPFVFWPKIKNPKLWIFILGIILAIGIEKFALATSRWEYNALMPIIPILNIGLTPAIQLGLLGLISFRLVAKS